MAGKNLELRILTPARTVFEGAVRSLVATAWDGKVGILPRHAPYLTLLGRGGLAAEDAAGNHLDFALADGIMRVESNQVTVLAARVLEA